MCEALPPFFWGGNDFTSLQNFASADFPLELISFQPKSNGSTQSTTPLTDSPQPSQPPKEIALPSGHHRSRTIRNRCPRPWEGGSCLRTRLWLPQCYPSGVCEDPPPSFLLRSNFTTPHKVYLISFQPNPYCSKQPTTPHPC